eukprot:gb/GEZJ01003935.1/.p1 GENE.gb/GEZJ01003935.1/~~gb/GEZJ01003935.1/.p1  ORF type:complete len:247 (-),score=18.70 gb/GEZJ01003935.1/:253-993(-)
MAGSKEPDSEGSPPKNGPRSGPRKGNRPARTGKGNSPLPKYSATKPITGVWSKRPELPEAFVMYIGGTQFTYHHPIGITDLAGEEWVATPTRDVESLLSRRKDENLSAWAESLAKHIRAKVLNASKGRKLLQESGREAYSFEGNIVPVTVHITNAKTTAKAAGSSAKDWVKFLLPEQAQSEKAFQDALETTQPDETWIENNPKPKFQTMGGPTATYAQSPVSYLKGLDTDSALNAVMRKALGMDSP